MHYYYCNSCILLIYYEYNKTYLLSEKSLLMCKLEYKALVQFVIYSADSAVVTEVSSSRMLFQVKTFRKTDRTQPARQQAAGTLTDQQVEAGIASSPTV